MLYLDFWKCEVFRKSQDALFGDYFLGFFSMGLCLFCFGKSLLNDLEENCDLQMSATTWWGVGPFWIEQTALSLMEKHLYNFVFHLKVICFHMNVQFYFAPQHKE